MDAYLPVVPLLSTSSVVQDDPSNLEYIRLLWLEL